MSSMVILASTATNSPSAVRTRGLISISEASSSINDTVVVTSSEIYSNNGNFKGIFYSGNFGNAILVFTGTGTNSVVVESTVSSGPACRATPSVGFSDAERR